MSKKYEDIQDEPLMASEPVAAYGLRTDVQTLDSYSKSPNARTPEEMHAILTERIRKAEAGQEEIIPNQVVFGSIRTKYGF